MEKGESRMPIMALIAGVAVALMIAGSGVLPRKD
jgi:hypothetical protein